MPIEAQERTQTEAEIKHEVLQEIQNKTSQQIENTFLNILADSQEVASELNAEVASNPFTKGDSVLERPEIAPKATGIRKVALETVVAIKENKMNLPATSSSPVLKGVVDAISLSAVNERTAPYINNILQRGLNDQLKNAEDYKNALRSIDGLKYLNSNLYTKIFQNFYRRAELTATPEQLDQLDALQNLDKRANRRPPQDPDRNHRNEEESLYSYYGRYFTDDEDRGLITAIYDPNEFIKYLAKIQAFDDDSNRRAELLNSKELSAEIELKIVGLFSKLLSRVHDGSAEQTFEEAVEVNPMHSIQGAFNSLRTAMTSLYMEYEKNGMKYEEEIGKLGFTEFSKRVNSLEESEAMQKKTILDANGNIITTEEVLRPFSAVDPTDREARINIAELVQFLSKTAETEYNVANYCKNVTAILLRPAPPPDKGGFWGQMASYSHKLGSTDIDAMNHLPDADIVDQTRRIYSKYLSSEFAKSDWRHEATLFTPETNSHRTKVQNDILRVLRKIYKGKDEWRLRRALDIAIGQSRGVTLEDEELSSFADPAMDPNGEGVSYINYYPNETALEPLNMNHATYRWQSGGTMPPVFFMPIQGEGKPIIFKNHREVMDLMALHRNSYIAGNGQAREDKTVLFADFLINPGKIGSFLTRGGWRIKPAYKGYFEDPTFKNPNHLTNWKIIENIGYEVLLNYSQEIIKDDFFSNEDKTQERNELLDYLFDKYVKPTSENQNISLEDYMKQFKVEAEDDLKHELLHKGIVRKTEESEEQAKDRFIEEKMHRKFLNRALAGVAAQRFGSKFMKFERTRFTKDGVRAWQKVRETFSQGADPWAQGSNGIREFDTAVKNIGIAESMLRAEMSTDMKSAVSEGQTLDQVETSYILTEANLRKYLGDVIGGDENGAQEIDRAVAVFKETERQCTKNDKFLRTWSKEYMEKDKRYPFSWGAEELDMSFLSFNANGEKLLPRSLADISKIELGVTGQVFKFWEALHTTATDGKMSTEEIVGILKGIKEVLVPMQGMELATKVVHHLAVVAINYFKVDDDAQGLKAFTNLEQKNSLAAEYGGLSTSVWEWKKAEIDNFLHELESKYILPLDPYDFDKDKTKFKFIDKKWGPFRYKERQPDFDYCGQGIREEAHVTKPQLFKEAVWKVLAIMGVLAFFLAFKKALEDLKSGGGGGDGGHH